jgi:hypothetical protein
MDDIYEEIKELRIYNNKLARLLENPQPGLITWAESVIQAIEKMERVIHPDRYSQVRK